MLIRKIIKEIIAFQKKLFSKKQNSTSILMYHSVGNNKKFSTVKLSDFEKQIEFLLENGYRIISLDELITQKAGGVGYKKRVVLTFDDGYEDFYLNVFPVLKKSKIHASLFVATNFIGKNMTDRFGNTLRIVSVEQILEMVGSGHVSVYPHSMSHVKLNHVSLEDALKEISGSRLVLENITQKKSDIFSYPFGRYTNELVSYFKNDLTWRAGITTESGFVDNDSDIFLLPRNSVDSEVGMQQFRMKV